ncbi:MAG TPA: heavy metal translocating P-type ATPase [Candidatus Saccharimonadales bacterium]|jgi:heavy metal translocating P-type ATPase|nr:heavy metal translocating P-type ATPase [Candidatus Saccharimonadales bacterium]
MLRRFRHYFWFWISLLSILIGLVLELTKNHTAAHRLLAVVAIIEVLPVVSATWQDVRTGKYVVNILGVAAVITSVILGQYWTAIVMVLILTGNQILKDLAERQAKVKLNSLNEGAPKTANVLRKGKTVEVRVDELRPGDKVVIKAGELVPADCVILEGTANFDESFLTGEALPQAKQAGDHLISGSINLDESITAKITVPVHDSYYQQYVRLVKNAASAQAPFTRLAEFYSLPFTLLSFGIAAAAWVIGGQSIRFLDVMVVATTYPLLAAVPIAIAGGLAKASRNGIIVKTSTALERLTKARLIAFNKTGTLTQGQFMVEDVKAFGSYQPDEVLRLAASLEQKSDHTIAQAIVESAKAKQLKLIKTKHVQTEPSRGLKATLQGQEVVVGQLSYIRELGIELPAKFQPEKIKHTTVYVAQDNQLIGVIILKDELRPEAKVALAKLKQLGLGNAIMMTGDAPAAAQSVAGQLGIEGVYANLLPADKIHTIEGFKQRPVFVGGGPNDALALNTATVGIALGARNLMAASGSADVIISAADLSRVALAVALAKRTFRIARQSTIGGLGLSLVLMMIFATGKLSPFTGVWLQEVINVYAILNALRASL